MISEISHTPKTAKALPHVRRRGSFTAEAALVVPLFLFAAVAALGLFPMLQVQIQVTKGLQYASRIVAASCRESGEEQETACMAEGNLLFFQYLQKNGIRENAIRGGTAGISLLESDFSGDFVTLRASYRVELPVSFWKLGDLPVRQSVRSRKWTGAATGESAAEEGYVYITPTGAAYHRSASCPYLDLSVRSVSAAELADRRNRSGEIYDACGCYDPGSGTVYITDYGNKYHGDLNCSGLKRTVWKVRTEEAGGRHPCQKCCGGT